MKHTEDENSTSKCQAINCSLKMLTVTEQNYRKSARLLNIHHESHDHRMPNSEFICNILVFVSHLEPNSTNGVSNVMYVNGT